MVTPILSSIQVGAPRQHGREDATEPMERLWTTGVFKEPVAGALWLGTTNLEGDGQADLIHHGGPDKAVLAYSADHYTSWQHELQNPLLPFGAFGENFTIQGLTESDVCIGDIWQVGSDAIVQVSQPRQPCWKLARRWRIKSLALQLQQTGRTGWYFRVIQQGRVEAGMVMTLRNRIHPKWSITQCNHVMHSRTNDITAAAELAAVPELSENWRTTLLRRCQNQIPDPKKRLIGENE